MRRQKLWRVRVNRVVEEWVDVSADTPLQAEQLAANLPKVISVFTGSALRGEKPVGTHVPAAGIEDGED